MTGLHLLDRLYGRGSHKEFKRLMKLVKPDVRMTIHWTFERLPSLDVTWADGAYIKLRLSANTVHVEELANASSGESPEGLYRTLALRSKLPMFFRQRHVHTITCEPSDEDARKRLGRYDLWEVWSEPNMHPVWVWWLGPRRVTSLHRALGFAHSIQIERQTNAAD